MALLLIGTATNAVTYVEDLRFALFGGGFTFALAALGARLTYDLSVWLSTRLALPDRQTAVLFLLDLAATLLLLGITGEVLGKPFLGLLAIVALPLFLSTLLLSWLSTARFRPIVYALAALIFIAPTLYLYLSASSPLLRPPSLSFASPTHSTVQILSWNLGTGQPFSRPSPIELLPHVTRVIAAAKADIVCLQEAASEDYLNELLSQLGPSWQGKRSRSEEGMMITAILSKHGGSFEAPAPNFPYGGPAIVHTSIAGAAVSVLSVHFPPEHTATWRAQYAAWLRKRSAAEKTMIIGGDFNVDPEGFWDHASTIFTDNVDLDQQTLGTLLSLGRDVGAGTAGTAVFSRRIDRLYVPTTFALQSYQVLSGSRRGPMDHDAILVVLNQ